ncbi:MAG: hypothetical protein AAFQ07_00690 [Chloroflexota bacterium]
MPIVFQWDDDTQTIARFTIEAPINTWDEYHTAIDEYCRLIETLPHTVHIIFDAPTDVAMPPGNPIANLLRTFKMFPQNAGATCSIIAPGLARRMLRAVFAIINSGHKLVPDLDAAYALIEAYEAMTPTT